MCSVADDSPMLLVCMNDGSTQTEMFFRNKRFCVNVLTCEHQDLAALFAGRESDMEARYGTAEWVALPSSNQALADAIVSFDCPIADVRRVGTHNILFGEVGDIRSRKHGHALLYMNRNYVHVPAQAAAI